MTNPLPQGGACAPRNSHELAVQLVHPGCCHEAVDCHQVVVDGCDLCAVARPDQPRTCDSCKHKGQEAGTGQRRAGSWCALCGPSLSREQAGCGAGVAELCAATALLRLTALLGRGDLLGRPLHVCNVGDADAPLEGGRPEVDCRARTVAPMVLRMAMQAAAAARSQPHSLVLGPAGWFQKACSRATAMPAADGGSKQRVLRSELLQQQQTSQQNQLQGTPRSTHSPPAVPAAGAAVWQQNEGCKGAEIRLPTCLLLDKERLSGCAQQQRGEHVFCCVWAGVKERGKTECTVYRVQKGWRRVSASSVQKTPSSATMVQALVARLLWLMSSNFIRIRVIRHIIKCRIFRLSWPLCWHSICSPSKP